MQNKRLMLSLIIVSAAFSFFSQSNLIAADTSPDWNGMWINQRGSVLTIAVNGSQVTGDYLTAKASSACAKTKRPLVGFVNGDLITFTVDFQECESMTSWTGQVLTESGSEKLVTMWNLAVNSPDANEENSGWATNWSGSDIFTKQP